MIDPNSFQLINSYSFRPSEEENSTTTATDGQNAQQTTATAVNSSVNLSSYTSSANITQQQNNYPSISTSTNINTNLQTSNIAKPNGGDLTATEISCALSLLEESNNPRKLYEALSTHIQNTLPRYITINDEGEPILTELGKKILGDSGNDTLKKAGVMVGSVVLSAVFPPVAVLLTSTNACYIMKSIEQDEKEEHQNRFLCFTNRSPLLGNQYPNYGTFSSSSPSSSIQTNATAK